MKCTLVASVLLVTVCAGTAQSAEKAQVDTTRGDRMIADYFRVETRRLTDACLSDIKTLDEWKRRRGEYRRQLYEMLGLDPLPPKTDLHPVVTGTVDEGEFVVEKVQFQSSPGLYVTGNLYRPKKVEGRLPAILYVCGHGGVKKNGISYGSKVHYQYHGAWFAKHGYVCLVIDTLQLGEIEGIHHGTYQYGMWWWLNRGYTPAGVEAWNCIRALDYLETRADVDAKRFGVTGRSGGGAYSWWIAAIDERIQAAVPVAGITDLQNYVVDGCVEGHCDCMFFFNTYRWDYPLVAALVAPRPLLLGNSDSDGIFPLDGVIRTFEKVRGIYRLYGAADKFGLAISSGPHKDTQELQVPAFRWFNLHLKQSSELLRDPAESDLQPEQLRVFRELPADQKNTQIQETFVPAAAPASVPGDGAAWLAMCQQWRASLDEKVFAGWPQTAEPLQIRPAFSAKAGDVSLRAWDFTSQGPVSLRLYVACRANLASARRVELNILNEETWPTFLATYRPAFERELHEETLPDARPDAWREIQQRLQSEPVALAYVAPRGIGPTAWNQGAKKQVQMRRRFYLLGQTLDGMRVWDVRRAVQAVRSPEALGNGVPLCVQSEGAMGGVCLYAAMYESEIAELQLRALPRTHRDGPYLLNVQRVFDLPQAVALVAGHTPLTLKQADDPAWDYPRQVLQKVGAGAERLRIGQ